MTINQFTDKIDGLLNDLNDSIINDAEFKNGILDILLEVTRPVWDTTRQSWQKKEEKTPRLGETVWLFFPDEPDTVHLCIKYKKENTVQPFTHWMPVVKPSMPSKTK